MNASQIQAFLNAKVPTCDTNGTKMYSPSQTRAQYGTANGYPPPYTCLKEYIQDTPTRAAESGLCTQYNGGIKSASEIIYEVGKACGINPQVLIVLLQKEQSLVTDDWPWGNQYAKATGFGCPDVGGCDPAYGGFFYQVFSAARQFKKYARDANNYGYRAYRNNKIYYNPGPCVQYDSGGTCIKRDPDACGSSIVYIQNQATAGLYVYTPYQPNAATLAAPEGVEVNCGAYGNLNFWRTFSNWFGSTIIGQKLSVVYKAQNGTELYAVWDGVKYYIPTWDMMIAWGFHNQPVNVVSDQTIADLTTGPYLSNIAKMSDDPNSPLFLFDDSKRYPIPGNACAYGLDGTPNPSTSWGLDCFNSAVSKSYPKAFIENSTAQDITLPDMIAFHDAVWKLDGGKKRRIVDSFVLDVLGGWGKVRWMKDSNAAQPLGKVLMRNGWTVRFTGSPQVYLFDNDALNPINSPDNLIAWGLHNKINDVPSEYNDVDPLPVDTDNVVRRMAKDRSGNFYLVEDGYKMPLGGDTAQWPTDTYTYAPETLNTLPTIPLSSIYLSNASGQIFTVYDHKRYAFPTMDDFFQLGANPALIRRLDGAIENLAGLSYGGMHLASGRLYKVDNNPHQIYMVKGSTSLYVNAINYPGLPYDKLIIVDPITAARYPVSDTYQP